VTKIDLTLRALLVVGLGGGSAKAISIA